ncbi:ExeA family protein [Methyloversatilis discipulorum]|uniref:ExeA family protein n=1 Tax=Methyloversatilis discipulorum TaxID=1119528 RepID=UPI0012F8C089|nr:AAA family ATPase [Methyloversatilis discipulorum]
MSTHTLRAIPTPAGTAYINPNLEWTRPMKLREVMTANGISHSMLRLAIRGTDGELLARSTVTTILSRDVWPQRTPREWIEKQIRDYLRSRGLAEADHADLFGSEIDAAPDLSRIRPRKNEYPVPDQEFNAPEPAMLSPQARKHFSMFREPFPQDLHGADEVFLGPDQLYANEALWDAVKNNRLFALVGESGAGKSTLIDLLRDRIQREQLPVRLLNVSTPDKSEVRGRAVLEAIVRDLDSDAKIPSSNETLSRLAHKLLAESAEAGQHTTLMFEEAHDLTVDALKLLKRFHEFKVGWQKLLSIVLIGQPELTKKLNANAAGVAREVARRLEVHTLLPLDSDLEDFVAHRLKVINVDASKVFAADAYDAVRQRLVALVSVGQAKERVSMCYPLLVGNLLTRAMNEAAHLGAAKVDANIVRSC